MQIVKAIVSEVCGEFGWQDLEIRDDIIETNIKTDKSQLHFHIQFLPNINGISIVSQNMTRINPDKVQMAYELAMFRNQNLILGSFEVQPLERYLLYKQSNIFPNFDKLTETHKERKKSNSKANIKNGQKPTEEIHPVSAENLKEIISSLIVNNISEMDATSQLIGQINTKPIEQINILEMLDSLN